MKTEIPLQSQANPIPAHAGIGLRQPHYQDILEKLPAIHWLEIHSENYFVAGGKLLYLLEKIRAHYPLSLHGVGLSLGSTDELNLEHLQKLKNLIARINPGLISEHVCWSSIAGRHLNDLLPLPYTEEALHHLVQRIKQVQEYLDREILIENISSYLQYPHSTIPEWDFLVAVARQSGCKILLDINNIYVNAVNHGFAAERYLAAIPANLVSEIHLAGFTHNIVNDQAILIDTHSNPVTADVWQLYQQATKLFGKKPTLIEWDTDIPQLDTLLAEAYKAEKILGQADVKLA